MRVRSVVTDEDRSVDTIVRFIGDTVQFFDRLCQPSAAQVQVQGLPLSLRRLFPSLRRPAAVAQTGPVWGKAPGCHAIKALPETVVRMLRRAPPASSVVYGTDQPPDSRPVCHLWSEAGGALTLYVSTIAMDDNDGDGSDARVFYDGQGGAVVLDGAEVASLVGACTQ